MTGILEKIASGIIARLGAEGVKSLLSPSNSTVRDKMRNAFYSAQKKFHEKHGNKYGKEYESFLANQENFDIFLKSLNFSKAPLKVADLSPKGFDGTPDVPLEVIEDFIQMVNDEFENEPDLKNSAGIQKIIEGQKEDHNLLVEIHNILSDFRSQKLPKSFTSIPPISIKDVVGRDKELEELKQVLEQTDKLLLVNGLGGVGKTTIAKAFIKQYENEYDHLAWIDAPPNLSESIISNVSLIDNLNLKEKLGELIESKKSNEAYELILNRMKRDGKKNLIVLDNVHIGDKNALDLLIGQLSGNWKVLLTSRQEIEGCEKYPLDVLSPEKARELFLKHYSQEVDEEALSKILKHIGYHTLTIELLAKTADKNFTIDLKQVLGYLQQHELNHRKLAQKVKVDHTKAEVEMYTHLLSIFELDTLTDDEKYLLKQFALLPPIEIEDNNLKEYLGITEETENDFINALDSLWEKGYITKAGHFYKVHQIIQDVVVYKFGLTFKDCETLMNYFSEKLRIDQTKDNPIEKFPFAEYGTHIRENIEHIQRFNELTKEQSESYSIFLSNLATVSQALGRYKEAAELSEKALKSAIKNFGEAHPNVATSQSNLAAVYLRLNRIKEALELFQKAKAIFMNKFGPNHPHTKTVQGWIDSMK